MYVFALILEITFLVKNIAHSEQISYSQGKWVKTKNLKNFSFFLVTN